MLAKLSRVVNSVTVHASGYGLYYSVSIMENSLGISKKNTVKLLNNVHHKIINIWEKSR